MKKLNKQIRGFMEEHTSEKTNIAIEDLITDTQRHFNNNISRNRITGNISACVCYYQTLNYNDGIITL